MARLRWVGVNTNQNAKELSKRNVQEGEHMPNRHKKKEELNLKRGKKQKFEGGRVFVCFIA